MIFGFNIDDVLRNTSERIWNLYKKQYPNTSLKLHQVNIGNLQASLNLSPDKYHEFIEDYMIEIYGSADDQYKNSNKDFNRLVAHLAENGHKSVIIQEETGKVKNATLYFISNRLLDINDIHFIQDPDDIWTKCDVFITANPKYLADPFSKKMIKVERPHNYDIISENTISEIKDMFNIQLI
jgi:hypothetical protein